LFFDVFWPFCSLQTHPSCNLETPEETDFFNRIEFFKPNLLEKKKPSNFWFALILLPATKVEKTDFG
jgi:hypothetical protein